MGANLCRDSHKGEVVERTGAWPAGLPALSEHVRGVSEHVRGVSSCAEPEGPIVGWGDNWAEDGTSHVESAQGVEIAPATLVPAGDKSPATLSNVAAALLPRGDADHALPSGTAWKAAASPGLQPQLVRAPRCEAAASWSPAGDAASPRIVVMEGPWEVHITRERLLAQAPPAPEGPAAPPPQPAMGASTARAPSGTGPRLRFGTQWQGMQIEAVRRGVELAVQNLGGEDDDGDIGDDDIETEDDGAGPGALLARGSGRGPAEGSLCFAGRPPAATPRLGTAARATEEGDMVKMRGDGGPALGERRDDPTGLVDSGAPELPGPLQRRPVSRAGPQQVATMRSASMGSDLSMDEVLSRRLLQAYASIQAEAEEARPRAAISGGPSPPGGRPMCMPVPSTSAHGRPPLHEGPPMRLEAPPSGTTQDAAVSRAAAGARQRRPGPMDARP